MFFLDCPRRPKLHGYLMVVVAGMINALAILYKEAFTYMAMVMFYIGFKLILKGMFLTNMRQLREISAQEKLEITPDQWEKESEFLWEKMNITTDGVVHNLLMMMKLLILFFVVGVLFVTVIHGLS